MHVLCVSNPALAAKSNKSLNQLQLLVSIIVIIIMLMHRSWLLYESVESNHYMTVLNRH